MNDGLIAMTHSLTSDPSVLLESHIDADREQTKSLSSNSHTIPIKVNSSMAPPSKSNNKSSAQVLVDIGKSLTADVVDAPNPSIERCQELVGALEQEVGTDGMTVTLLKSTSIGVTLGKTVKAIRRHKRVADSTTEDWSTVMDSCQRLLSSWKETAKQEASQKKGSDEEEEEVETGGNALPSSVSAYRQRLVSQKKDMYKDPPVLPPASIAIETTKCPLPKRDKKTGMLTFQAGENDELKTMLKDFHPNRTPEEVLRAGSFGGTYFRPITSAVTNMRYNAKDVLKDTVDPSWIKGLDSKTLLTSSTYRNQVNKFGVKCGGSLGMWESSGWISECDPYGWFQWYCRFYMGRRCSDDARQISRWLKCAGPKGRFRSQLCNKILAVNTTPDDRSISPVIRQTLLHWGLEITADVLQKHRKRVNK
jgi:hypothetical protein